MTKGVLTSVKSQEVKTFGIFSKTGIWKQVRENIQDFESLSETIRLTKVCEGASFLHSVSACMSYKARPDEDYDFGQIVRICREYTLSRVNSQSRASAAIPAGTIIGPVIEFRSWKFLTNVDLKLQFHHPMKQNGHPMLWFPEERVCSWMKLRSSAELLTELQKAEGRESCLGHSKKSMQETGAAHVSSQTSIKETCADTLSVSPSQAAFFTQRTILTTDQELESYSCQFFVWRSSVNSGLQNGYKKGASLTTKVNEILTQHLTGIR